MTGLALLTIGYHHVKQIRRSESDIAFELGEWVRDHLPQHAIISMYDSFITAVFAPQHAFVDLNGLVENLEGARLIRQKKLRQLMEIRGCEFLVETWVNNKKVFDLQPEKYGEVVAEFSSKSPTNIIRYKLYRLK